MDRDSSAEVEALMRELEEKEEDAERLLVAKETKKQVLQEEQDRGSKNEEELEGQLVDC